jgi:hypothetical protein
MYRKPAAAVENPVIIEAGHGRAKISAGPREKAKSLGAARFSPYHDRLRLSRGSLLRPLASDTY